MALTVTQISKSYGITRQAIILKIREGKIKAKKNYGRYYIEEDDYLEYRKHRYVRFIGKELLYDKKKGYFSPREAAEILNCTIQRIYYQLRRKMIPSKRYKSAWILHIYDIMDHKNKYCSSTPAKKNMRRIS